MSQADINPSVDLENFIKQLDSLTQKPPTGASAHQNLWYSWQFLQIYSTYGLRLPHTEATLKLYLGVSEPSKYLFFAAMVEAYNKIYEACYDFTTNIFPQVIEVGTSLLDFAEDASPEDGQLFDVLLELINKEDWKGSLELVIDIKNTSDSNAKKATNLIKLLNGYKGKLETAQETLGSVKKLVDQDEQVSQSVIDNMTGGAEVSGSIQQLQNLLNQKRDEYDHAVVVASTTVTYAWVFPYGTIAAITVASIYGNRAVEAMEKINELEDQIKNANQKLYTAVQTNKTSHFAGQSVSDVHRYTDLAIVHTTIVQNAWTGITANLSYIADKVTSMIDEKNQETRLKGKVLLSTYAKTAGKKWAELVPQLIELTRNPYIVVQPGEKSLGEFAKEVEREIKYLAKYLTA